MRNQREQPQQHYEGVFSAVKKSGEVYFRASLTYHKKHISLGSYDDALTAHNAYLEGSRLLSDSSITLASYRIYSILPFEKWVCLINFRDNGIYLGNPIYVKQKILYYYMTPTHVLKFDMDDLFYFTSHKIMQRGNHYFVADYGMQVNLASRYGIKNYAVPGVDFRFINGDNTDFRRENLEIFNTYHGVRIQEQNGQRRFAVRIHVIGNYQVGVYDSALEAAIAYNKAADTLRKNGFTKKYALNYIEGLSFSKYAEIYSELKISQKIIDFRPDSPTDSPNRHFSV